MTNDPPLVFRNLARQAEEADFPWQPLRPGIDIHNIYGDHGGGPSAALLRYAPGGRTPFHVHQGHEHIFVLSGSQRDHRGVYLAGDFIVNEPGFGHMVESAGGCLVLVVWERPPKFVE